MKISVGFKDNYDFSENELITGIDLMQQTTSTTLHLFCLTGDEPKLFGSLPKFIHENFKVHLSANQIFIDIFPQK